MDRETAARALEELATSPASAWIGNRIVDGVLHRVCTRCGAEATLAIPPGIRGPEDVPDGFDETMFHFLRAFQIAHEGCAARASPAPTPAHERDPDEGRASEASRSAGTAGGTDPGSGIELRRLLSCEKHGPRRWQGHILCDACGQTYQTDHGARAGNAPAICRCGHPLLPPRSDQVGDALGLQTGGVVIDEDGNRYQTPAASDWTARPICYLCHRYVAKHHGGRVPIDHRRN